MVTNSTPEPIELGIHDGMPEERYHAIDACSSTRLNALTRSPAHCRQIIDEPLDGDVLLLGSATHAAILEPSTFGSRFMYAPEVDGRTVAGKAAKADAEILAAKSGRRLLPGKWRDQIGGMSDAVWKHPAARALLGRVEVAERSILWREAPSGLLCKSRLDGWCPAIGTVIDLKTTTDASPEGFAKSAENFGYWLQAAFYRRAAARAGLQATNSVIIAVEKEPPFAVAVYCLADEDLADEEEKLDRLMTGYSLCVDAGEWPGYSKEVELLNRPAWARARRLETGLVAA